MHARRAGETTCTPGVPVEKARHQTLNQKSLLSVLRITSPVKANFRDDWSIREMDAPPGGKNT